MLLNNLRNNPEAKSFVKVFAVAIVVVILTGILALRPNSEEQVVRVAQDTYSIITPPPSSKKDSLQIRTFKLKKNPKPATSNTCKGNIFNEEPDIIFATDPAFGGVVRAGGQIKIWVWEDDGNGGSVSLGTVVDPATGMITTPGNRTLADPNGYLWEPAIYLTKLTTPDQAGPYSGDKESGGRAYFPIAIKGVANYGGIGVGSFGNDEGDDILNSAPIDPPVNIIKARPGSGLTYSEFIWDVNSLGLTAGYYRVQIILHDGDKDLAINCTTIQM